jgi:hypothetical protein
MNYQEGMGALQLIAEQEIGVHIREAQDREDRQFNRSVEALRREQQELIG